MKRIIYFIIIFVLVLGVVVIFSIKTPKENKKIEPLEITLSTSTMLSAECADKNYIINSADYIIDVNLTDIEIKEFHGSGKYEGQSWNVLDNKMIIIKQSKGDLGITQLSIITNPGLSDQPEFSKGKLYRLYLYDNEYINKTMLVCEFAGVEELGLI